MWVMNWLTSAAGRQTQRPRFRFQDNETLAKIWSEVRPVKLSSGIENLTCLKLEFTDDSVKWLTLAC